MSEPISDRALAALKRIYDRPQPPVPWRHGGNLPWDDPAFSERMLKEHLDQSHGAASRRLPEIRGQVQVMCDWLGLAPGRAAARRDVRPRALRRGVRPPRGHGDRHRLLASLHPPRPRRCARIYPVSSSRAMCARWISPARDSTRRSTSTASSPCSPRPSRWTYSSVSVRRCAPAASSCWRSWTTPSSTRKTTPGGTPTPAACGETFRIYTWASGPGIPTSAPRSNAFTSSTWKPARCRSTACRIRRTPSSR